MLATVLFINYVDRGAVPTAAPLIQHDLHLTNEQLGRLFSAFFWVYALIQIPVGWLAERYGAHRVLAAGLIVWATATMLVGVTSSFAMLIALRMMLGLGESAGFPCVSKLLASVVPIKGLGQANGIVGVRLSHRSRRRYLRRGTPDRLLRLARHLPGLRRDLAAVARAVVRREASQARHGTERRADAHLGRWFSDKRVFGARASDSSRATTCGTSC